MVAVFFKATVNVGNLNNLVITTKLISIMMIYAIITLQTYITYFLILSSTGRIQAPSDSASDMPSPSTYSSSKISGVVPSVGGMHAISGSALDESSPSTCSSTQFSFVLCNYSFLGAVYRAGCMQVTSDSALDAP